MSSDPADDLFAVFDKAAGGQAPQESEARLVTPLVDPYFLRYYAEQLHFPLERLVVAQADNDPSDLAMGSGILGQLGINYHPILLEAHNSTPEAIYQAALDARASVLLMDQNFPGGNGLDVIEFILNVQRQADPDTYMRPVLMSNVGAATDSVELKRRFASARFVSKRLDDQEILFAVQQEMVQTMMDVNRFRTEAAYRTRLAEQDRQITELEGRLTALTTPQVAVPADLAEPELAVEAPPTLTAGGEYRITTLAEELQAEIMLNVTYHDDVTPRVVTPDRIPMSWEPSLEMRDIVGCYGVGQDGVDISYALIIFMGGIERIAERQAVAYANDRGHSKPTAPVIEKYAFHFSTADDAKTTLGKGSDADLDVRISLVFDAQLQEMFEHSFRGRLSELQGYMGNYGHGAKGRNSYREGTAEEGLAGKTILDVDLRFPDAYESLSGVDYVQSDADQQRPGATRSIGRVSLVQRPLPAWSSVLEQRG